MAGSREVRPLPSGPKNERIQAVVARLPALETDGLTVQVRRFLQATHDRFFTTGWQTHAHFELGVMRQGVMRYEGRGFETVVRAGEAVLIPAGAEHRRTTVVNPSHIDGWHLLFVPRTAHARGVVDQIRAVLVGRQFRLPPSPQTMKSLTSIDEELTKNSLFLGARLQGLVMETPVDVLRTLWPVAPSPVGEGVLLSPREEQLLLMAKSFIDKGLGGSMGTHDVARHLGVGERYVNLIFEKSEECSCGDFIRERRLLLAYELIDKEPQLKIREVSRRVGVEDPLYFSKIFRKRFGLSAREVRDRRLG